MQKIELPVAFFDSGLGGISVLRETVRLLPQEDYLYFGDSLHAPYGVKSVDEVVRLSLENAAMLTARGIKALVVACNTVTSAAIATLREHYPQLPIIGTEPALKPAVERHPGGRILVMATAMTLSERKFSDLREHYQQDAEIIPLACSGLMEFVERGELSGPNLEAYLHEKLDLCLRQPVDAIVLGCTHYPIVEENFHECYPEMHLINPALEQANAVKAYLTEQNALNPQKKGKFVICTSGDPQVYVNVGKRLGLFEASELKVVHI